MATGRITLLYYGDIVQTREYTNNSLKNKIKDGWAKMYGPKYKEMEIKDAPNPSKKKSSTETKKDKKKSKAIGNGSTYSIAKSIKSFNSNQ